MSDQNPSSCGLRKVGERGGLPLGVPPKGLTTCSVILPVARTRVVRTFEPGRVQ